jgi:enoyl-CoA hydratase/carnithine racemase
MTTIAVINITVQYNIFYNIIYSRKILFHFVGTLKTPYVALIDGITMGGVRMDR